MVRTFSPPPKELSIDARFRFLEFARVSGAETEKISENEDPSQV